MKQFVEDNEIETVEGFIEALPNLHRKRFVMVYDSEAANKEYVSPENPRVIAWGDHANTVFAWLTNPDAPSAQKDSIEFLVQKELKWDAGVVDFSGDEVVITRPESCQTCHGTLNKPCGDSTHSG